MAVRRRIVSVMACVLALCLLPATASAARGGWQPARLARQVLAANLRRAAHGFKPSLGLARCSGKATVAHCTIRASVSNDDVLAHVSFARHRDGTHLTYVDKLTLTAVMGGGSVTRTYYGSIYSRGG